MIFFITKNLTTYYIVTFFMRLYCQNLIVGCAVLDRDRTSIAGQS